MVTDLKAAIMVENGTALRVHKPREGTEVTLDNSIDRTQVITVVNRAQTPRVDMITRAHMERAYVSGNKDDIDHIELFHEMLLEGLEDLMVPFVPHVDDMFDADGEPMPGRLIFPFGPDQRTAGGYQKRS